MEVTKGINNVSLLYHSGGLMIEWIAPVLSIASFLVAIYFAVLLSKESSGERYWFFFVVAAVGFGLAHVLNVLSFFMILPSQPAYFLMEVGQIAGAASLAYACFGLYRQMKKVRERIEGD